MAASDNANETAKTNQLRGGTDVADLPVLACSSEVTLTIKLSRVLGAAPMDGFSMTTIA
jgi:hypothetical protein